MITPLRVRRLYKQLQLSIVAITLALCSTALPIVPSPVSAVTVQQKIFFNAGKSSLVPNFDMYSMNMDGSEVTFLGRGVELTASKDGTKLAYSAYINDEFNADIFVMNADGSNPVNLTNSQISERNPQWSPDGQHILYESVADHEGGIFSMRSDGSDAHLLMNGAGSPSWSPDGSQFAFTYSVGGASYIATADANGTNIHTLTPFTPTPTRPNTIQDFPTWSPDGQRILWRANDCSCGEDPYVVRSMSPDGSNKTDIVSVDSQTGNISALMWTYDSQHFLVQSNILNGNPRQIVSVDSNTHALTGITPDMAFDSKHPIRLMSQGVISDAPPNSAPVIQSLALPADPVVVGSTVSATANFTDVDTSNTHTAIWDWGDGITSSGTIAEAAGSGAASETHTYLQPGVYSVTVTLSDNNGANAQATYSYVVVYGNTDATVSVSGKYLSEAGWTAGDPTVTGDVQLGIQAKYHNSALSGIIRFKFKAADLDFDSTNLQWLVIDGSKAQLKTSGTLNGAAGYSALIVAQDSSQTTEPDTIRIKITDSSGAVVYDTQPGLPDVVVPTAALAKGSVKIN